jgi:hypothetical protein
VNILPEGQYRAKISRAEFNLKKRTKKSDPTALMVNFVIAQAGWEGIGVCRKYALEPDPERPDLTEQRRAELHQLLDAAAVPLSDDSFDRDDLVDKIVYITVRNRISKDGLSCLEVTRVNDRSTEPRIALGTPVVVTTAHRDVWWGYLHHREPGVVVLVKARHGYHWDTTDGVGQLTTVGPGPKAQIGCEIYGRIEIGDVVCCMETSPEAAKAWREAQWTKKS